MSEEKVKVNLTVSAEAITPNWDLTPSQKEMLIQLSQSPGWKIYRQMLVTYKDGILQALISQEDPVKIQKQLGTVAGITFALNQLGIQIEVFKRAVEREEAIKARREARAAGKRVGGGNDKPPATRA